jgi:RNA polymerase sigma factor (sigma-70 family)
MTEDAELLRRYAEERSEAAFAELVQRHLPLVYSVALRQVEGDAHLAEDVAQTVFAGLARKAGALSRHPVLSGWLYRSTQFAAIDVMRSERRRRAREQEAQTMHELSNSSDAQMDAEKIRPVLDQVMGELNDGDRDAVMLRFFEGRPFSDIGGKLRLTEDAARMRVDRALDKLRERLVQRGVTSTTAVLATTLANQAAVSAPAGLAAAVTGTALSGAAMSGVTAVFMSMTKLQIGIVVGLLAAGAGGIVVQEQANASLTRELEALRNPSQAEVQLLAENQRLRKIAAELAEYRDDSAEMERLHDEAGAIADRARTAANQKIRNAQGGGTGGVDPSIYPMAQLDQMPKPVTQATPQYPLEMRRNGITGNVTVRMTIDAKGDVTEATPIHSSRVEFDDAAVQAVKQWKFEPGQKNGQPVTTQTDIKIVFSLNNENPAQR